MLLMVALLHSLIGMATKETGKIDMPKIRVTDIDVFYTCIYQGKEQQVNPNLLTMLISHGGFGTVDHQLEIAAWKCLSDTLQLIYFDQRGCGQSDDGHLSLWTVEQFGKDIHNLSNALNIKHPIVGGISSGGYATLAYAVCYPSQPRAMILLNTEPVVNPDEKKSAYIAQSERHDKRDFAFFKHKSDSEIRTLALQAGQAAYDYDIAPSKQTLKTFIEKGYNTISKTNFEFIPPTRENMKLKNTLHNGYKMFDYSDDLPSVKCPILWFAGEWDPLHPPIGVEKSASKQDNIELHILKAGAPVYQDAKDDFDLISHKFLHETFKTEVK